MSVAGLAMEVGAGPWRLPRGKEPRGLLAEGGGHMAPGDRWWCKISRGETTGASIDQNGGPGSAPRTRGDWRGLVPLLPWRLSKELIHCQLSRTLHSHLYGTPKVVFLKCFFL